MGLYDRLQGTAIRLIKNYGKPVVLRRKSVGATYDPTTGAVTPVGSDGSFDEIRMAVVFDQPGKQVNQRFGVNESTDSSNNQTLMEANMKWIYMGADGSPPTLQDRVLMDGSEFTIVDLQTLSPGGTNLYYQLVLRT